MHNHYLLSALREKFICNSVSVDTDIKSIFYENNGIQRLRIPIPSYKNISHYLKFPILKERI